MKICVRIFLVFSLASSAFALNADLENWSAPERLIQRFPYYLSGTDNKNQPIWVAKIGKFPLSDLIKEGPDAERDLEKYLDQAMYRMRESRKYQNTQHVSLLVDYTGFKSSYFSNHRTMKFLMRVFSKNNLEYLQPIVMVNVDGISQSFFDLYRNRLNPKVFENIQMYGTLRSEWLQKVLELFPVEQIPETFGGNQTDASWEN